jgi:hypothetical protein
LDDPKGLLKWSLLGGAAYFTLVSAAHFLAIKAPTLYVYYDLPSTRYQDIIISFMALGWALFHVAGFSSMKRNSLRSVRYIILAGIGGVVGLAFINASINFTAYTAAANVMLYWVETALLAAYVGWIAYLYILSKQL